MPDVEVFSEVIATLSETLIDLIPGDKEDFLSNNLGSLSVLINNQLDKNLVRLTGKFEDINNSRLVLESKLLLNPDKTHSTCNDSYYSNKNEEPFDAKVCKKKLNDSLAQIKDSPEKITEDITDEELKDYIHENQLYNKDAKVIISKSGREIKVPDKLSNYKNALLDHDDEDDVQENETNYGSLPKRRKKRKTKRPQKLKETKQFKTGDNLDAADDVKLIDNNAENETSNGNVYLNKGEKAKPKVQYIYGETTLGTKGIKKYYEDRLPFKYFCEICSFKSKRESHFLKHTELHQKNPDMKLYKCDNCDFTTIRVSVLQRHSLSHVSDDGKILKCSECQYTTNNETLLRLHKKRHISNKSTHSCHLCSFSTVYKKKFITHLDSHVTDGKGNITAETKSKTYQCNRCLYNTTNKLNFQRHQRAVHLNQRPHLCDICGMAFKRTDALRIHKEVHKDRSERKLPFVCKVCQKAFKSMAHVKEHMSVHSTVRSFQCDICGQMFKTRQVQQRHLQGVHLKTNWLECSRCKRSFSSKYTLKRHLRQHDDENNTNLQGNVEGKRIFDQVTTVVGQQEDYVEGQGQEVLDENATAIRTITISSENLGEFTQHLQSVSSQLQSSGDIGEVYIQGLENVGQDTINIVSIQGDDIGQILTSSSEPIYTEHVPQLSTSVEDSQNTGIVQDLISENDKIYSNLSADQSLQIISESQPTDLQSVRTPYNMPVETYKLELDQENSGTESSTADQIINQANSELQVLNYETIDVHYVSEHGQVIEGEEEGRYVQFIAPNGQTYRVKVDRASVC